MTASLKLKDMCVIFRVKNIRLKFSVLSGESTLNFWLMTCKKLLCVLTLQWFRKVRKAAVNYKKQRAHMEEITPRSSCIPFPTLVLQPMDATLTKHMAEEEKGSLSWEMNCSWKLQLRHKRMLCNLLRRIWLGEFSRRCIIAAAHAQTTKALPALRQDFAIY